MNVLVNKLTQILGLDPIGVPPEVFALEGGELRYARFEHGEDGSMCTASRVEDLPVDSWPSGALGSPFHDTAMLQSFVEGFLAHLDEVPRRASLVLPDSWVRLAFAEFADLPGQPAARDQVVRWKLKRLVPFKVEELRVSALEVTPFPGQTEPQLMMLGFAVEALMQQLEQVFSRCDVSIGHITNASLAALPLVGRMHADRPDELGIFVVAVGETYSVTCFKNQEPIVFRFKTLASNPDAPAMIGQGQRWYDERECESIRRELRLTSRFLSQHFPEHSTPSVFVSAPPESQPMWTEFIEQELDQSPIVLSNEQLGLIDTSAVDWTSTAPLLGATLLEVD